jgi:carbon starvation protein CstA
MPVMLGVLAVLAVAYRYYSAFLAARVAALNDAEKTPAHVHHDGRVSSSAKEFQGLTDGRPSLVR